MQNSVNVAGRIATEPQLRYLANGTATINFRIAVEKNYKTGGQKGTDYFTVIAWKHVAEYVANYLSVGRDICLTGHLQSRVYQPKSGGPKQYPVEIVADSLWGIGRPKDQSENTPMEPECIQEESYPFDDE